MSKITNDGLTPIWNGMLHSCTIWQQWASKGSLGEETPWKLTHLAGRWRCEYGVWQW